MRIIQRIKKENININQNIIKKDSLISKEEKKNIDNNISIIINNNNEVNGNKKQKFFSNARSQTEMGPPLFPKTV